MKLSTLSGLAASVALLSACSYFPRKAEEPLLVHVNVVGARGSLTSQETPSLADMNFPAGDGKPYSINFPMTQSFECDEAKTRCKHAVVNTELTISSEKASANSVKLSAVLRTKNNPANNINFSQDSKSKNQVAQISSGEASGRDADVQQLNAVLQRGASLELNGSNDVKLRITVK